MAYFEKTIDKEFLFQLVMNKHFSSFFKSRAEYHNYIRRGNKRGFYMWFMLCNHIEASTFALEWVVMSAELHDTCVVNVTPLNVAGQPTIPHNAEYVCGSRSLRLKATRQIEAGEPIYLRSYCDGPIIVFTSDKYVVNSFFEFPTIDDGTM